MEKNLLIKKIIVFVDIALSDRNMVKYDFDEDL